MPRQSGTTFFVLAFALVPWVLEACNRAANVLEGDLGLDEPPDSGYGGSPGWAGYGGLPPGTGGAGSGGMPGYGGTPAAGGGSAGGSPAAGGGPSTAGASGEDPHAEVREILARELCALPSSYLCLNLQVSNVHPGASLEEKQLNCPDRVEAAQRAYGDRCWNEWYDNALCALNRKDYCPCSLVPDGGNDCTFVPENNNFGNACYPKALALEACALGQTSGRVTAGDGTNYDWSAPTATDCFITGKLKTDDVISVNCIGGPGGHSCQCLLNGSLLRDGVLAGLGDQGTITGQNCSHVAAQLAYERACVKILDCCFTDPSSATTFCQCTARPGLIGYDSCAALAASESGTVVDICPQYRGGGPQ